MRDPINNERSSGIFAPVAALPSSYGIGDLRSCWTFLDFLSRAGQRVLLFLPVGQTGYGDSPYSSLSSMGGSMYYISPDWLCEEELVSRDECAALGQSEHSTDNRVDYGALYVTRKPFLRKAYRKFIGMAGAFDKLARFSAENEFWITDYALFMAIKDAENGKPWWEWSDRDLKTHRQDALDRFRSAHADDINFFLFVQYEFDRQMRTVREKAQSLGIRLAGDIPFYPASDSADCWAHRELFRIGADGVQEVCSGVPSDSFNTEDRIWGMPLYAWDANRQSDYRWWTYRLKWHARFFEILRIDHAIALMKYYQIYKDGRPSEWLDSPFDDLCRILDDTVRTDHIEVLCEDLGRVPDGLRETISHHGWMQMRVVEFACGSKYCGRDSHIFHAHIPNMTIFSSTHDVQSLLSHLYGKTNAQLRYLCFLMNTKKGDRQELHRRIIERCYDSPARLCIFPLQDITELETGEPAAGGECYKDSWTWRVYGEQLSARLADRLRALSVLSNRIEHTENDIVWALDTLCVCIEEVME